MDVKEFAKLAEGSPTSDALYVVDKSDIVILDDKTVEVKGANGEDPREPGTFGAWLHVTINDDGTFTMKYKYEEKDDWSVPSDFEDYESLKGSVYCL